MANVVIPKVVALFETTLQTSITSTATSMTLVSGTDKAGNSLSGTFGFIIDEGTGDEEFVIGSVSGTAITSMTRGIDPIDGKTEVTALKKAHTIGATIKVTNYPVLAILQRILAGSEDMDVDYSGISTIIGWSSYTNKVIRYTKIARLVFVYFYISGISNSTTTSFTLPVASLSIPGSYTLFVSGIIGQDNGTTQTNPAKASFGDETSTVDFFKNFVGDAWTASGTKIITGCFWYISAS